MKKIIPLTVLIILLIIVLGVIGYFGIIKKTIPSYPPSACANIKVVSDINNNIYNTVQIGSQCWLKENLKVTKNPEGKPITRYCYENIQKFCEIDGGLYDWNTIMNGSSAEGAQGICPNGWHVPKDSEWHNLEKELSTDSCLSDRNSTSNWWGCNPAGSRLKKEGNSGFDVILAGMRVENGVYVGRDSFTNLWSSLDHDDGIHGRIVAWTRYFTEQSTSIGRTAEIKEIGFSLRCIKN